MGHVTKPLQPELAVTPLVDPILDCSAEDFDLLV